MKITEQRRAFNALYISKNEPGITPDPDMPVIARDQSRVVNVATSRNPGMRKLLMRAVILEMLR